MTEHYQVKEGDCIASIAFARGFSPDTLWNLPENAQLKELRKDPNILLQGDSVFVPDKRMQKESGATAKRHRFRRKGIPEKLRLILRDEKDQPRSNMGYILSIDGVVHEGVTTYEGLIERGIPPGAREATLRIREGDNEIVYVLPLGALDPITAMTGIKMRLRNLDFYNGTIDSELNEKLTSAIEEFQIQQGLAPTGELDSATRVRIEEVHGS